jgi:restriction system protein
MAVPDYQSLMLPLLEFAQEKNDETSAIEAIESIAKKLNLSESDLEAMLPSGIQSTFFNRVGWAVTYMKKAAMEALMELSRRTNSVLMLSTFKQNVGIVTL